MLTMAERRRGLAYGATVLSAVTLFVAMAVLPLGLKALGTNPAKSSKDGVGEADISVSFGDATFTPRHWLYSDEDGIVVAPHRLTL